MATVISGPRAYSMDIKLEYGVAQTFALKYTTGKNCGEARFPPFGPRVMYTSIDDRKLWLGADDASDVDHALLDLGIQPGEFVRMTKIKHPRGGGSSIRVERADEQPRQPRETRYDNAPEWVDAPPAQAWEQPRPTREEALLEQSVALARQHGARAFQRPPSRVSPETPPAAAPASTDTSDHSGFAHQLKPSFLAAVDAIREAQRYADAQGLKVTFTSEDVRATAISAFIQAEKAAMGGRW
jgi:hypothetical protein